MTVFDTWVVPSKPLATGNQDEDAVFSVLGRDTVSPAPCPGPL